ncbi:MAG: hypothetical protein KKD73_10535 [Proteobacteria bacterium]|nr:hypothetical protein [Pseudomonadota bacterium]MBU1640422.1 hypothetical protein [Pseudomonadota bacterium]
MQSIHLHKQRRETGRFFCLWGCFFVFLALTGCQTTTVDKWKPVQSQHKNQVHTVTWDHENLQVIAKWYTGSEQNWKEIADANPNILPSQLRSGDRILIPILLLKTRAAMTKSFLDEWQLSEKQREATTSVKRKDEPARLLVPKLHKLKQDDGVSEQDAPLDLTEPDDDGNDLELFGPK